MVRCHRCGDATSKKRSVNGKQCCAEGRCREEYLETKKPKPPPQPSSSGPKPTPVAQTERSTALRCDQGGKHDWRETDFVGTIYDMQEGGGGLNGKVAVGGIKAKDIKVGGYEIEGGINANGKGEHLRRARQCKVWVCLDCGLKRHNIPDRT